MTERGLDPTFVRREIDALRVTYPDIADDDELFALALESETGTKEFLTLVVKKLLEDRVRVVGLKSRIEENRARQERFERRVDAWRDMAFKILQHTGLPKMELDEATLSIRAGQPRVVITDESALPPNCVRIRTEPDKVAIKDRLSRGEPVTGAELSNAEPTLAVRTK